MAGNRSEIVFRAWLNEYQGIVLKVALGDDCDEPRTNCFDHIRVQPALSGPLKLCNSRKEESLPSRTSSAGS